ncbi:MAG TPA: crotonase/enoyl-CoA hydratase family protein [Caulobacteraceae bacterium]|nr:crotonase/enoyl-CoA hydratase family protein [Caulobacteraceae bacterium]
MSEIEFRLEGHTAVMTVNRPQARNAINAAVARGLSDGYARIVADPAIRVGVLTGAGGHFCSGMDLKAFVAGEAIDISGVPYGGANNRVVNKPMIAAVEGSALAGGFELALTCDLIVASRAARFGLPEVKRGLVASGGGLVKLTRQAPVRVAMEMLLTGEPMDAERLHAHGVVNRLAPEGEALAVALALADTIAANGPLALEVTMIVARRALDWPASEAFDRQREFTAPVFQSADAREGALAFAEKRKPRWTGA